LCALALQARPVRRLAPIQSVPRLRADARRRQTRHRCPRWQGSIHHLHTFTDPSSVHTAALVQIDDLSILWRVGDLLSGT
jgi:hypothetical protein